MKKVMVSLNSIDRVKTFVKDVSQFDCDFDLISGRYVIDAKSMLGIFSLDLSRPIELTIHADDETADEIIDTLKMYLDQ
ncbi:MAG: HPr family phosphocarrier protein [Lachnospiraceae bacterium]|nr:HPr family phosphocarrier protein [Lachnospiraceae bacterium]